MLISVELHFPLLVPTCQKVVKELIKRNLSVIPLKSLAMVAGVASRGYERIVRAEDKHIKP